MSTDLNIELTDLFQYPIIWDYGHELMVHTFCEGFLVVLVTLVL